MTRRLGRVLMWAAIITALFSGAALAESGKPVDTSETIDAKAQLMRMAEVLAGAPRFSVSVHAGYDVVQESGQKIEFLESRKILLSRPDKARVCFENPDGEKGMFVYDGKEVGLYSETHAAYATAPKTGKVDEVVTYLTRDLGMRMPLSILLMSGMPGELQKRVAQADLVETATLAGKPCNHIAARADEVDFQVWVTEGDQPLPLRIVITYKKEPGSPQFWAQLTDWNLAPEIAADAFTLKPPEGAERIAFFAEKEAKTKANQKAPNSDKQSSKGEK